MKEFVYRILASLEDSQRTLTKAELTDYVFLYAQRTADSAFLPSQLLSAVASVVNRLLRENLAVKVDSRRYSFPASDEYVKRAGDWPRNASGALSFVPPGAAALTSDVTRVPLSPSQPVKLPRTMREWVASEGILCADASEIERLIADQDKAL